MSKNTENTDAKANCDMTRAHIASLIKTLQAELKDTDMPENNWSDAGSLAHVREILAEAVGFLKGTEGSEIIAELAANNR